jgi:acyl-CoA carboxylase subunit beta
VCGIGISDGLPIVAVEFRFEFLGGSMGEATGRRLVEAIEIAAQDGLPLISSIASGGARMQEGMRALVQMQSIAAALRNLRRSGNPHIAVLRHPTTGGVWVSLAAAADVIIAVDGATVAFSGSRVRGDADDQEAFTSAAKFETGAVDAVVPEVAVGDTVRRYLRVLCAPRDREPCPVPEALLGAERHGRGWDSVTLARDPRRPRAGGYLNSYFDEIADLSGDRAGGRDPQMRCGIGLRDGNAVAFVAQLGGSNRASGFRTATRVLELAERLEMPVLTLIDTPGAEMDATAEMEGIGTAIAEAFAAFAVARVPVTSLLIGEGGSGGALAISAPRNLWAVPASYFAVIAPEYAASILYRDPSRAAEAAEALRLAPSDLLDLKVVRGIVPRAPSLDRAPTAPASNVY